MLTPELLKVIELNRNKVNFDKRTCKYFVKILNILRGETNTNCFCSQSERNVYGKYFYEQYDQITQINDAGDTI